MGRPANAKMKSHRKQASSSSWEHQSSRWSGFSTLDCRLKDVFDGRRIRMSSCWPPRLGEAELLVAGYRAAGDIFAGCPSVSSRRPGLNERRTLPRYAVAAQNALRSAGSSTKSGTRRGGVDRLRRSWSIRSSERSRVWWRVGLAADCSSAVCWRASSFRSGCPSEISLRCLRIVLRAMAFCTVDYE